MLENELLISLIATISLGGGVLVFFLKNKFSKKKTALPEETSSSKDSKHEALPPVKSWWSALEKSRGKFLNWGLSSSIEDLKSNFEEACILSDLGVQNTDEALSKLNWSELLNLKEEEREYKARELLAELFNSWVSHSENNQNWPQKSTPDGEPHVIWFLGVNGVGKTTSIAKFAEELKNRGHSVMLAAGDTFRAAASEQLETWAQRLDIPCIRGSEASDSSAIYFDAIHSAKSKKIDYLLCDSAGRLHNQKQLMEALQKNARVMNKAMEGAPHERILILDANMGQNMLQQLREFKESVAPTGIVLTKLDGSARGGAIVSVVRESQLPIYRLGVGERSTDWLHFDAQSFAHSLVGIEKKTMESQN